MQEQLKPAKTLSQIAKDGNVSIAAVKKQIAMGTKIEGEHTTNKAVATKIAKQHVDELPDYYTRLKKMEKKKITEDHKEIASGKMKDEEGYMANVEFDQIERSINILRKVIKKSNHQIPAWVQSKITRAADFIDTAAEYMQSDDNVTESVKRIQTSGQLFTIMLNFLSKVYTIKMYFPSPQVPSREEVNSAIQKVYPGAKVLAYYPCMTSANSGYVIASEQSNPSFDITHSMADVRKAERAKKIDALARRGVGGEQQNAARRGISLPPLKLADEFIPEDACNTTLDTPEKRRKNYLLNIGVIGEGAAWTRKEGQNKKGGLNEKGRKSYERENPGSDLKAPSKKVGNPRRASFCARMKGMRKRQKPSNNTGKDRLSLSLRAWNC
jgi:hypothetical protein